jgi:uncharacterized protein (TIGR01777 family)
MTFVFFDPNPSIGVHLLQCIKQVQSMQILLTGGTGFIGSVLIDGLTASGHSVIVYTRQSIADTANRRYLQSLDELADDTRLDAVINLAGASLAGSRWTDSYKREIFSSRLDTTRDLLHLLERLKHKPSVLLSASAIGYYGHHGDEELGEDGSVEPGFSQGLCSQWETLAQQAKSLGIRVCLLRLGVVLDSGGGAMLEMARPFEFGVANWIGNGRQWLSWVHRRDVVRAITFLLEHEELEGPFNITAPEPVTSRGFCAAMKRHKRTFITAPVPAPVIRLLVGPMAEELLLNGQRVVPVALQLAGFDFSFASLEEALSDIC